MLLKTRWLVTPRFVWRAFVINFAERLWRPAFCFNHAKNLFVLRPGGSRAISLLRVLRRAVGERPARLSERAEPD